MGEITNSEAPFPEALAPWKCKGEMFWFLGHAQDTRPLEPSSFSPLESASTFADDDKSGKFRGGVSSIFVVRYTETPVGPYDEIIWVPGKFDVPLTGKKASRITRIYVSSKESVYNGRRNWNVCKTLAHFEFTPNPNASKRDLPYTRIAISPPGSPDLPFFLIDLVPIPLLSKGILPINTAYWPIDTEAVCPPLPQSPTWREDGLVGTDRWVSITSGMKGSAGIFRFRGALEGGKLSDGIGFPIVRPWPIAMWMRDFELDFPLGVVLDKKDT